MLVRNSFEPEHIKNLVKTRFKKRDPQLLEKVIYALHLLEQLTAKGLSFVFKGGTSLVLILNRVTRFSIDLDLVVHPDEKRDIESVLDEVVEISQFTRWEENKRADRGVPKQHFRLFYKSQVSSILENYILLDLLYEEHQYPNTIAKKIESEVIVTAGRMHEVIVPCANSILGDKLTAFAPNTSGILYGSDKELEIVKQLFDVANLFDLMTDINLVSSAFYKLAKLELDYRNLNLKPKDVLKDSFRTSLIISRRGKLNHKQFTELEAGIKRLKGFVIGNFNIDQAILCASKAAYLAMLLQSGQRKVERFTSQNLEGMTIMHADGSALNKLSKSNPEAFFYWFHAFELAESEMGTDVRDFKDLQSG